MTVEPMFYASLLPRLTTVARERGYALAVHGSMRRDLDLIAVPWTNDAMNPLGLVRALCRACGGNLAHKSHRQVMGEAYEEKPIEKPHGRLSYSIYLSDEGGDGPYLDVSVMPLQK